MKKNLTLNHLDFRTGLPRFRFFLLMLAFGLVSAISSAQSVSTYSFSQGSGTYTPITGGTTLVTGVFDNQISAAVTIPSFTFAGASYTSVYVSANGFVTFGSAPAGTNYTPLSSGAAYSRAISAFAADLGFNTAIDAGASPEVRYELVGNEFVIQWQDVKRWNIAGERISFQIRLNTSTNVITIVYGGTITPGISTTYLQTGLRGPDNTFPANINNRTLAAAGGAWTNSTAGTANSSTMYFNSATATTVPAAGTTFTWTPPPPCVVPSAQPTALVLTPASATNIGGSFTAASPVADGYLVVRTTGAAPTTPVNGTTYTTGNGLGGRIVSVGATATFTDNTGLAGNTSYTYYVFSYNSVCSGGPVYNTVTPLTGSASTCPAVPGSITTSAITLNSFDLNWASSVGGASLPVSYTIDVATDNAFVNPVVGSPFTVNAPAITQTIPGLNGGTTYYYRIRANSSSCNSAYSTVANVATQCVTPTAQATALVLTPTSATSIGGSFTAASPAAERYLVVRTTGAAPTTPVNGTTYTTGNGLGGRIVSAGTTTTFTDNTGLVGNTSYTYYVFAYNSACTGGPVYYTTAPLTGAANTCAPLPTVTTAGLTTSGFTINWTSALGGGASAVTYTVDVATDNAFTAPVVGSPFTVSHPTLTQPVTGLAPATIYYYRVKANAGCSSAYSATASVTTLCNPTAVPTTLEVFGAQTLPTCWSRSLVTGTTDWATFAGASGDIAGPYAGTHFMEKNYASSDALLYSLPLNYTAVATPTQINVWMHRHASAAAADRYRVFVNTTASLTGATQVLEMFSKTTSAPAVPATGWYNYQIPVPASFNGQAQVYIIFQGTTSNGFSSYDLGIDNFVVEYVPTCFPVTALTVGAVGSVTANFSWTAPVQGTPVGYEWKVVANGAGPGGTAVASGTTTVPTVSASASGLTPNTAYQVLVRTNCGAGDFSSWVESTTFTTACAASNIPYVMPITAVTSPALPTCTSLINVNADDRTWRSFSAADLTLTGWTYPVMGYPYHSTNAANDWLFTQGLNLTGGVSYRLSFKYNNDNGTTYAEKMKVMYGSTANVAGMTNPLADYPSILNTTPQSAVIDFTPGATGVYYIGFQAYSAADRDVLILDDVSVELTPTCFPVTALAVTTLGSNSANISWTAPTQGAPANYIWKAVAAGAGVNGTTVSTGTVAHPTLTATVGGLTPTTAYDVYVRTECGGGDSSSWAGPLAVVTTQIPVTVFPYTNTFESGLDGWQTTTGTEPNKWVVGTAVNNGGTQALYISNDAGVSNAYTLGTASVTHAYRDFQLPAGFPLIQLAFDWRSMGDAAADRMRVWVVPTSYTPVAGTQITATGTAPTGRIQLGLNYSGQATFDTANFVLPLSYQNQSFRLVFEWRNNATGGTQPPAALDNINVTLGTCSTPSTLAASTTPTSASLSWVETGVATMWDIEYGPAGFTQGTGTVIEDATDNPYTLSPLNPSTAYSFYVRGDCGGSQSPWGGPFNFQTPCLPLNVTGTTPGTRCGIGSVTLGATGDPGAQLNWYAASTGGTSLGMGTSFNTPSIGATTNYYVSASTISAAPVAVGAGATTGTAVAYNPTQGGYGGLKGQYLFTAAELTAAGLSAGNITALALDITVTGSTLDSFAVQMGTTALTTFTTPITIAGGLTTVRPYASFVPAVGTNTITFTTPFNWDGTSNIIVSTSWSNHNSSNTASTVRYDNTTNYSSQTYRKDNEWAANMFTFTGATGTGTSTFDRSQNRPKMTFTGNTITCVSARTSVTATVTTPPAIAATVTQDTICAGTSVDLSVSSSNTDYSYVWNPGNSTANPYSVTPATTTQYIVLATDNSGGANNGCVTADTVNVLVNPIPAAPVVTPATANGCVGAPQELNASSLGAPIALFSENFEGVVNMTTTNTSTGTNPANAAWTVRNDGYQNTGGTTVFTFHSPNNSKFMMTNSDAVGNGSNVVTQLISPVINTTGYTGLSLAFDHNFKARLASNGKVDVSGDGGTNWTTVQTYTTTDAGLPDAFAHANINLDTYVNNPNFRIRFVYTAGWDWFWALDNIVLNGNTPIATAWTAVPAGGAGLPAGAENYSVSNSSIDVTPTAAGSYTYIATVQSAAGCTSAPDSSVITVNAAPVVDAGATQTVCPGDTVTLSGSGASTYVWDNGVSNNTGFVATSTTLYTVTGTDANGCSAEDTVSVIVNPASAATITPSGPLTFCQNETLTLTAGGPANGPTAVITQWNFNASNLTPSTGTGTATLIGGTTSTYPQGTGSTDLGVPNNALNTLTYPVQGTASQTAGIQYNVSTAGYTNVSFKYDVRFSGTAANTYIVQYNPDITNGFSPWVPLDTNVYSVDGSFINNQTINLAGVPAAQNNPNFGIRIVSAFAGSTSAYAPVNSANYGTGGTVRYDMVTFTGNPVPYTVEWAPGGQTTYSINPTTSGTYTLTVTETGICSGTASVDVTVNPVATTVVNPVICADATYTLVDGTQVSTAGIYTRTTTSVVTGCDSIVAVNLTVNPVYNTSISASICSNEQYTLADGTQVNTAGTHTSVVPSALGCDSTVVVTLTVLPAYSSTVTASICANETYTLPNGTVVSTAGSYPSTFTSANGCDSTITTTLTVKPVFTATQNVAICQGDSHTMPDGSSEDTGGTYEFPFTAINGCDSTITVNLTVNPVSTTNITVDICPDDDYTLVDGTVVDASGTYTAMTTSASGCDSTVIAVVTVRPNEAITVNASICQGDTYTLVNGNPVTTAGTYVAATQSVYGCDSVVTVNLTLKPVYNQSVAETICQGETYTLPDGTDVTAGGVYTSELTSVGGCDSTIVTTLTVSPLPNLNLGNDIVVQNPPVILNAGAGFASYDWSTSAQTQTITVNQAGTYSVTVTNGAGCEATDSISVHFTASIANLGENGGSISLFPNPATERFSVNVYGYTGGGSMKLDIINAVGQVVKTEWVANAAESFTKEMDIATLPSGSYTVRVKGTNAEANLRLIIAR